MRIAVCLKLVHDPTTVEVDPLTGIIDAARTLYMMNLDDAAALETALRLRGGEGSIQALTVGPDETEAVLRDALAVGADTVVRLWDESHAITKPSVTSTLLAASLRLEDALPDLILCGARSLDRWAGKVPALLGEHLDRPVVTDVTQLEIQGDRALVQRRLARGARSESEVMLPAVLGVESSLARLRQATLPGLMRAKAAKIPVRNLFELGLSVQDLQFPTVTLREVMPPAPRPRAIFIPDPNLPPYERAAQIMSAGVAKKSGQVVSDRSPEEMADAIIDFLRARGFLESAR
jgi:electron transfer flavoprotein beta subunit